MGIVTTLSEFMGRTLTWFYAWTQSWGLSIVLLTLLIRLLMFPLTLRQSRSMAVMKVLQPKLKELQAKYKDKPQEAQKRMMELYKEHKVNPLGGCFPMLLQLPFLWGLFIALRDFQFTTPFLIWDLTQRDPTYLLPILAGVTTWFQTSLTMTDPTQKSMLYVMPVFMAFISNSFPAGLVLYWVVNNVVSVVQQYWINQKLAAEGGPGAP